MGAATGDVAGDDPALLADERADGVEQRLAEEAEAEVGDDGGIGAERPALDERVGDESRELLLFGGVWFDALDEVEFHHLLLADEEALLLREGRGRSRRAREFDALDEEAVTESVRVVGAVEGGDEDGESTHRGEVAGDDGRRRRRCGARQGAGS